MAYILGFDLGTSSCKAALYDEKLELVCYTTQEYPTIIPSPGWAEQPAEQWWDAFCNNTKGCLKKAGVYPQQVAAVGIDTMGSVALPVDKNGQALHPGLLWMDRRSMDQCRQIDEILGDMLYEISGNRNDPSDTAPKLMWFMQERPEIYEKTHRFLHANGYLVMKLTGAFTQDRTECGLTLLCDTRTGEWSDKLIRPLGLDREKLPAIHDCHDIVGEVTASAAEACGLAKGTAVVAGAMDCVVSALGTGCLHEGDVYMAGGTVTALGIVGDTMQPNRALHLHNHVVPGKFVRVGAVDFGGGGLRWFRNMLGEKDYHELDRLAGLAPPGNDGLLFLPYMVGQRSPLYNSATTGVMFGLTPDHEKKHLARMFMEGTSYAVRNVLHIFKEASNTPKEVRLTGGMSNSSVWTQTLSDITGVPIEVTGASDVATLGDAATAAVAVGWFKNYNEAFAGQRAQLSYAPISGHKAVYDAMFDVYMNVFRQILPSYDYVKQRLQSMEIPATEE